MNERHSEFAKGKANHTKKHLNETARLAKGGDRDATDRLGEMMQPYVINYLSRFGGSYTHYQRDEMTQEAWVGVWDALGRWDPEVGTKFSSYAYHWMRHYVMEWVASNSRSLRLPRKSWHYAALLKDAWEADNPDTDLWDASPEALRDITIFVQREGEVVGINLDGGQNGTGIDALDVVRALRQPYSIDPELEPGGSQSAEAAFFEDKQSALDIAAVEAIGFIREAEGDEEMAWAIALDLCDLAADAGLELDPHHIIEVAGGPA